MAGQSIEISFDDNRRLPLLYGGHNANLARIERQLGVKLTTRGNVVSISGPVQAAETAKSVLNALWLHTSDDAAVGPAEVDAALRLKPGAKTKAPHDPDDKAMPVIRTRRKTIASRTQTQSLYLKAMNDCELVLGIGPAGTGKTYLAVAQAVAALQKAAGSARSARCARRPAPRPGRRWRRR